MAHPIEDGTDRQVAVRASFSDRTNFSLQVLAMAVNNGFWLALWFLFFAGFREVGGWRLGDVARMLGVIYTLFGAATVFFGGYRDLAGAIIRGEIGVRSLQEHAAALRGGARGLASDG